MIDYRKSFLVQLYDQDTLKKGPVVQIYGLWASETYQDIVSHLVKKFPNHLYGLIGDGFSYPKPEKWLTRIENKMIEELF